jgi:PhnB protein
MTRMHLYLNFAGNAEEAFELYRSVFGGEFSTLVRFRDLPMDGFEVPEQDQDKMMHIALPIGAAGDVLMASDVLESLGQKLEVGNNAYVSVHPATKEEADHIFTVLSEGGEVEMPIGEQPWGDYFGSFQDRYGVRWMVDVLSQET